MCRRRSPIIHIQVEHERPSFWLGSTGSIARVRKRPAKIEQIDKITITSKKKAALGGVKNAILQPKIFDFGPKVSFLANNFDFRPLAYYYYMYFLGNPSKFSFGFRQKNSGKKCHEKNVRQKISPKILSKDEIKWNYFDFSAKQTCQKISPFYSGQIPRRTILNS